MCPKCNIPMLILEWKGVEIDMCLECRGIWLDEGELELISERAGVDPGRLTKALQEAGKGKIGKRECPRCDKKLRQVHVQGQTPLDLDECPEGHGIWFDQGELRTLIGSHEQGEEGAVARFFADLLHDQIS